MVSQWKEFLGKNLEILSKKLKNFQKKLQITITFAMIRPKLLDNLTLYPIKTMLKPTETSTKVKFLRKKIKLQRKYLNHCIVFEIYRNFTMEHKQNTAPYKSFLHCITCYKFILFHQLL